MRRTHLVLICLVLLFTSNSCSSDGPDPDVIWDFYNYSIEFNVGNSNLLNDETFLSKVKIAYNGKEYKYSKEDSEYYLRATYCYPLAVRCYNASRDKNKPNNILGFGEFRPDDNYKNQKLTIDWGNGRVDEVEFDIYLTWKKGDPTVHKRLKINGVETEFAPLSVNL